jgi:hypothetical protein
MRLEQVLALLRRRCDEAGDQATWAKRHGISPAYVSDALKGRREPGEKILGALGLVRVVTYRWLDETLTAEEAAARAKMGMRSLYRRFGPTGTPSFGRVKRGRK